LLCCAGGVKPLTVILTKLAVFKIAAKTQSLSVKKTPIWLFVQSCGGIFAEFQKLIL
jgi:hypothetical protein